MKYLVITLFIMHVIFISCNKENNIIEKKESGYFVLTELKNSFKGSNMDYNLKSTQADFELGNLKASMQYHISEYVEHVLIR
ncbi:MAG: hypothetical protein ACOCV1_04035 [Bacillota bacterium]